MIRNNVARFFRFVVTNTLMISACLILFILNVPAELMQTVTSDPQSTQVSSDAGHVQSTSMSTRTEVLSDDKLRPVD